MDHTLFSLQREQKQSISFLFFLLCVSIFTFPISVTKPSSLSLLPQFLIPHLMHFLRILLSFNGLSRKSGIFYCLREVLTIKSPSPVPPPFSLPLQHSAQVQCVCCIPNELSNKPPLSSSFAHFYPSHRS
jgi:hypothetical protein